jgi:DNA-binding LytR/AlgR family response regulator
MEEVNHKIWVKTSIYKKKVLTHSILYCKAENRKVDIYFHPDGKLQGTCHTLADMESLLPSCKFCRCNRQYLINIDYVEEYSEKIPEVVLTNGEHVLVAKERKDELIRLLNTAL